MQADFTTDCTFHVRQKYGRPTVFEASTPAEVLARLIDGYPAAPSTTREEELKRVRQRAEFARGVVLQYVAETMLSWTLGNDPEAERWLQRSASFGPDQPVLTDQELPEWTHQEVPLLLIRQLYSGATRPPAGPKMWLDVHTDAGFMMDLAAVGVIEVEMHMTAR